MVSNASVKLAPYPALDSHFNPSGAIGAAAAHIPHDLSEME
jgi:hypothetical protein